MFCVFNKKTGAYCDQEDSFVKGPPSDAKWIASGNVMGRNGGVESDYAVVETDDPMPQLCKLVDGEVVRDAELEAAQKAVDNERAAAIVTRKAKAVRSAEIKQKAAKGTASLAELNEFVATL